MMTTIRRSKMNKEQEVLVQDFLKALSNKKVKNFYFVACGGSWAVSELGNYLLDKEVDIPTRSYTANEFVHHTPKGLDENSVVITRSHSGTTPETVEAAKLAREKGALTLGITMDPASPLGVANEHVVKYEYSKEVHVDAYDGDYGVFFRLMYGIMNTLSPNEKYERALEAVKNLDELFKVNKDKVEQQARAWAERNKREAGVYVMASGENYQNAYSFASCLLMEMLWVHSNPIHTGEFFHGPFEITDFDVPFLILQSNGATRELDQRAINFAQKYSENVEVIDANTFDYPGVEKDLEEVLSPFIAGPVMRTFADQLSDTTGHPLSVRRYMWRMEY